MGCLFKHAILNSYDGGGTRTPGFRAQVLVTPWRPGQQVLLDYGPSAVEIQRAWGVDFNRLPGRNAFVVNLGRHGDEQGGFSFNAAGAGAPTPIIACVGNPPPPPPPSPPAPPSPPPSPKPPPPPSPPPASIFAPKVPKHLTSTSSSCASVGLQWDAAHLPDWSSEAPKHITRQSIHDVKYEISAQRADGTTKPTTKEVSTNVAEMGGLIPSTRYAFRVRAINGAGSSALSETTILETAAAMRAPDAPFEAPGLSPTGECTAIQLTIPPLRAGCGGDASLELEGSSAGGPWRTAIKGLTGASAVVEDLDPYAGTRFRLVAVNSAGRSAPGPASAPLLTDSGRDTLLAPPTVEATSSASFHVRWKTSTCRPALTWELLYANAEGMGANQWRVLESDIAGNEYEVQSVRCPSGCAFRLRPHRLEGLDETYTKPSTAVQSTLLHSPPEGSVRVELSMAARAGPDNEGPLSALVGKIAATLEVDASRFAVVEARSHRKYVVLDVLKQGSSSPLELAQQLARGAKSGAGGMEAGAPVLQIHLDGTTTVVEAPHGLGGAAYLVGAAVAAALIWAVLRGLRAKGGGGAAASPLPTRVGKDYSKVHGLSTSLDDDDDDLDGTLPMARGA
jgi:hypothetical protein